MSFRVRDLAARGLTRAQRDALPHTLRGVRTDRLDYSVAARCSEFAPRLPLGAFYSHTTAAVLWGLPLPPWLERDLRLHVSVPRGHRAPHASQVIGHQVAITPPLVSSMGDVSVSTPVRVFLELAAMLNHPDLIAVGDRIIAREAPLASRGELAAWVLKAGGSRGARNARAALVRLNEGAESRPETLMRVAIEDAGLPPLLVNEEIFDAEGRFVARVDLKFRDHPIAPEYDGDQHRTDPRQWQRDVSRIADLAAVGVTVLRATADDLPDFRRQVARCRAALRL